MLDNKSIIDLCEELNLASLVLHSREGREFSEIGDLLDKARAAIKFLGSSRRIVDFPHKFRGDLAGHAVLLQFDSSEDAKAAVEAIRLLSTGEAVAIDQREPPE